MDQFPVFIIQGEQGEGKTTRLSAVINLLVSDAIPLNGFIAPGQWEGSKRSSFQVEDLRTRESRLLCQRNPGPGMIKVGRFYFNTASIKFGEQILLSAKPKEICIIDEVGLFEVKGLVWATVLKELIKTNKNPLLISVRTSFTDKVIQHFSIQNPVIFSLKESAYQIFKKMIDVLAGLDLMSTD